MSHLHLRRRGSVALVALAAATPLGTAPASASPYFKEIETPVTFTCSIPGVKTFVPIELPTKVTTNKWIIPFGPGQRWPGETRFSATTTQVTPLLGILKGVTELSATGSWRWETTAPDGSVASEEVSVVNLPPTIGAELTGNVPSPEAVLTLAGTYSFAVSRLTLVFRGKTAAGEEVRLGTADDADGDPATIAVTCSRWPVAVGSTRVVPIDAPSKPGTPTLTSSTDNSLTIDWTASTDNSAVAGYDVFKNGTKVATVTGTSATLTGLTPSTTYAIKVEAFDDNTPPLRAVGDTASLMTSATPPSKVKYALAGSTTLKTLVTGSLPLRGSIDGSLAVATGVFTADLTLNDTSGRLVANGYLPLTAKLGFSPSGKTTGTLLGGVLSTNSKVRIKVKEARLFGAIPVVTGNTCQTKQLSDLNLKSTQPGFDPAVGGPLAGTYEISDLNGCGALNGLVSPLTAGGGNTINLNLTPKS